MKLEDVAIIIKPAKDNVAVVKVDSIEEGTKLALNGSTITLTRRALRGQSFAIKRVAKGEAYITLGDPIGLASKIVRPGDPIDETNLHHRLPKLKVEYRDNRKRAPLDPKLSRLTWDGFVRPDGSAGARNLIGVVTSGMCSSTEVREIAARAMRELYSREKYPNVDGVVPIIHETGCGMPDGSAVDMLNLLLADTLRHPNLASALYIDLGCGKTCVECSAPVFLNAVPNYQQRVVNMTIQHSGGSRKTVERGLEIIAKMLPIANQAKRQPVSISKLIVGTECGGSDRWSGVTANPAVGVSSDMFVKAGAAVLLPEIPELQGAAMIDLVRRARSKAVGRKLMGALKRYEKYVESFGADFRENPSPGNKKGGLYNIYLKSSGVKAKGGTSVVEDLVDYGEWLGDRKGLFVHYTPGYDQVCTPALFLSGAQVCQFTTGRGTGIGCAMGPVLKIGTNTPLARVNADIDINAGTILDGEESIEQVGEKIFYETLEVASGRRIPEAEATGYHHEFKVWEALWPTL
jgi:altronate hydrolase